MRYRLGLVAVVGLCLGAGAMAGDTPVGSIVSSGSVTNNSTTAVPFTITPPATLLSGGFPRIAIQCSALTYVAVGPSTVVASSANVAVDVNQLYDVVLETTATGALWNTVSILPVSGSSTCKVFYTVK